MEFLKGLWEWYIVGPIIGLFVPLFLLFGSKMFGISSSFDYICSFILPDKKGNELKQFVENNRWKFFFVIGIAIGAWVSNFILSDEPTKFLPQNYYSFLGFLQLFLGGLLVGFGTRYANGCTSGHSITGISTLQKSSLIATIFFFIGGLIMTFIFY